MCSSQNFIRKNRFPTPNFVNILNSVNISKKWTIPKGFWLDI